MAVTLSLLPFVSLCGCITKHLQHFRKQQQLKTAFPPNCAWLVIKGHKMSLICKTLCPIIQYRSKIYKEHVVLGNSLGFLFFSAAVKLWNSLKTNRNQSFWYL